MTAAEARRALELACRQVPGLATFKLGESARTPGAVVLPPTLHWEAYDPDPSAASFVVVLTVAADDNSLDKLLELVPLLKCALEQTPGSVQQDAVPTAYADGGRDLPAYSLTVEFPL